MPKIELERDRTFYRDMLRLMIPAVLQQAISIGVNLMDTFMLSSLGEAQLSASSLANGFYNIFVFIYMGVSSGCAVLSAQYWGAGNRPKTVETFALALRLSVIVSFAFAMVTYFFPEGIMRLYTNEEEVISYGVKYLNITAFIFLQHGCGQVLVQMMRTVKRPGIGLAAAAIAFVVNVFANWVFIFGHFGMPRMEIAGAALGTLIARTVEITIIVIYVFAVESGLKLRIREILRRPSGELRKNYLRLGIAALISDTLLGIGTSALNTVLGRMGSAVVSANAVCQLVDRLLTVVVSGVSSSAGVLVGHCVGKGDFKRADIQGKTFYIISIGVGLICAAMVLTFGYIAIGVFELEDFTVRVAEEMMLSYAFITIFFSIQSTMTKGVLRGGGDTRFLLAADVLFLWVLSLPLGWVVGLVFKAPAWITIICLRFDYIAKSVWCIHRFASGKWIHKAESAK